MQLHEFLAHALKPEIYQRKGQRFMNMLSTHRPDLDELLRSTDVTLNVFYDDTKLWRAVEWVKDNWDFEAKNERNY